MAAFVLIVAGGLNTKYAYNEEEVEDEKASEFVACLRVVYIIYTTRCLVVLKAVVYAFFPSAHPEKSLVRKTSKIKPSVHT